MPLGKLLGDKPGWEPWERSAGSFAASCRAGFKSFRLPGAVLGPCAEQSQNREEEKETVE